MRCEEKERSTDVELPREGSKSGLTVDAWEDVEGKLLWTLYDDVFAGRVPSDHVVVLWTLEEAGETRRTRYGGRGRGDLRVEFCEERRLGL